MGSRVRAQIVLVGSAGVHNHVKSSCRSLCSHLFRLCDGSSSAAKQGPNKPCFAGKRRSKQSPTSAALVTTTPSPPGDFTRAARVRHAAYVIYGDDETTVQRTTNLLQPVASVNTSSSEKKPGSGIAQPLLAAHVLGYPCNAPPGATVALLLSPGSAPKVDLCQLLSRPRSTNVGRDLGPCRESGRRSDRAMFGPRPVLNPILHLTATGPTGLAK